MQVIYACSAWPGSSCVVDSWSQTRVVCVRWVRVHYVRNPALCSTDFIKLQHYNTAHFAVWPAAQAPKWNEGIGMQYILKTP